MVVMGVLKLGRCALVCNATLFFRSFEMHSNVYKRATAARELIYIFRYSLWCPDAAVDHVDRPPWPRRAARDQRSAGEEARAGAPQVTNGTIKWCTSRTQFLDYVLISITVV